MKFLFSVVFPSLDKVLHFKQFIYFVKLLLQTHSIKKKKSFIKGVLVQNLTNVMSEMVLFSVRYECEIKLYNVM